MLIACPGVTCRAQNDARNEVCLRCQLPLQGYVQLLAHPNNLFNAGLDMARSNRLREARDLFAAVVYWCPKDVEARKALAMACFALSDQQEARKQWEYVLEQSPGDELAKQGVAALSANVPHPQFRMPRSPRKFTFKGDKKSKRK